MLREDLGPSVEAHSRRWELVVNAYSRPISDDGRFLMPTRRSASSVLFDRGPAPQEPASASPEPHCRGPSIPGTRTGDPARVRYGVPVTGVKEPAVGPPWCPRNPARVRYGVPGTPEPRWCPRNPAVPGTPRGLGSRTPLSAPEHVAAAPDITRSGHHRTSSLDLAAPVPRLPIHFSWRSWRLRGESLICSSHRSGRTIVVRAR